MMRNLLSMSLLMLAGHYNLPVIVLGKYYGEMRVEVSSSRLADENNQK
jgi:hypothetical protein